MARVPGAAATVRKNTRDPVPTIDARNPLPMISAASEQRFEGLLESAPDAIVIVDDRGRIKIVNGQAERLSGYSRSELVGEEVEILVPGRLREIHGAHRRDYTADPRTRPMGVGLELSLRRKDGSELPVEISLSPLQTDEGLLITSIIRDVSERKRAEAALHERERHAMEADLRLQAEKAQSELRREILHRSIRAQEEERRRIARELHDETAQALTGLSLGLGRIEAATDFEAARSEARRLGGEVVEAMRELRRIAMRLRPSTLDDLGLTAALEQLVEDSPAGETIRVAFRHPTFERRLDPALETTIYRVVQEALTNAARHAGASAIEVELAEADGQVIASVSDDGHGFDVGAAPAGGLGLGGMRERAELIGGELTIDSALGRGTEVVLRVPVDSR